MPGPRKALTVCAWTILLFAVSLGVADALIAPTPAPRQPDFIDTVLASRAVVAAIRIAIIFAAIFLVLSVLALIARRQWLIRVGPVEVQKMSDMDAENQRLGERLRTADKVIEDLKRRAEYTQQLLDREQGR